MQEETDRSLRYATGPDVGTLRSAYDEAVNELSFYFQQTSQAYNDRRNLWNGKSPDMRKHGADPFPWEGASDTEAHTVNEKINAYVSILMGSLKRANIRAYPVEVGDARSARVLSAFLKWMRSNYIADFYASAERSANYWLEKGLMITHVGWEFADRTFLKTLTLDEIAQASPEFAALFQDEANEPELAAMLQQTFPAMKTGRARRVVRQLRTRGTAEVPFSKQTINRPTTTACAPDADVFFPSWCIDPQQSPYVFWRVFMTSQQLEQAAATKEWNRDWVDFGIEHLRGVDTSQVDRDYSARQQSPQGRSMGRETDLIEVVYGYQRLIDEEDGSEGIYCTVFYPTADTNEHGAPIHGKHELLSGLDEYPFVVTRLTEDQKRLYDLRNFADLFRGTQNQVKIERDQRIDRASMATLPPIMHPQGRRPKDYGPGRFIPERREGEVRFGPTPQFDAGSMEIENTLLQQSDRVVGLDPEDPDSSAKKQFYVDKFLEHFSKVLIMSYKAYQRYGPEKLQFRVTGYPDDMAMQKGMFSEDLDLTVSYDVLNNDPDNVEKQISQLLQLAQMDKFGKMDQAGLIEVAAGAINPVLADAIIKTEQDGAQDVLGDVTDDLAKIYAGIEVGARQGGEQIALKAIEAYTQQPDVMERLQGDEAFQARLTKYAEQYQFQMTQAQNAQIGKLGNTPATFQGVE